VDINKFSNIEEIKRLKQELKEIKDNYKNSRMGQVLILKQTLEDVIEYVEHLETEYNNLKESSKKTTGEY
jgi:uncharacterized protein (UPF0335 family)